MGYDTYMTISLSNPDLTGLQDYRLAAVKKHLEQELGSFEDWGDEICLGQTRWYDQRKDMDRISRQFPDVLFCLYGDGDKADDIWYEYWLNGSFQYCGPTWPDYNPRKMRPYASAPPRSNMLPSQHAERHAADRLFEMDESELLALANRIRSAAAAKLMSDGWLVGDDRTMSSFVKVIRAAYDDDNAEAMLRAFTGKSMKELMG